MGGDDAAPGAETVNLARVPPFRLGALEVSPATRQLARGERRETLEPRMMQVLVALWRAGGAVVTRDDLIASCWDGRIVGDNAIHRTISRLRDVGGTIGAGCFRLETVSKVGYRLIADPVHATDVAPGGLPPTRSRRLAILAAAIFVALVGLAAVLAWPRPPAPPLIAIAAKPGPDSAELADGLAVDLSRLSGARPDAVAYARESDRPRADYRLTVAVQRVANGLEADIGVFKSGDGDPLWSVVVTAAGHDASLLRERVARTVSRVIWCALRTNNDAARSGHETLRLVFTACEDLEDDPDNTGVERWQRIVNQDSRNAPALATLAFLQASLAVDDQINTDIPQPVIAALRAASRQNLQRARSLDASLGLTYAAEALLMPLPAYGEQLATLDLGLARDPDCAALHALKSMTLQNVGRMQASVDAARKAVEMEPNSAGYRANLAMALAYGGFAGGARSEFAVAERIWPNSSALQEARFRFEFRFGNAANLVRDIDAGTVLPGTPAIFRDRIARPFFVARANPTAQNVEDAAKLAFNSPLGLPVGLQNLVALGRIDQAYQYLNAPSAIAQMRDGWSYTLFRVNMRPFWLDKRFMRLADRLGLVGYWQASGIWPDFCGDKDLPYNCQAEAARLHPPRG